MPNWCCQNVVIKGDRKELQDFADIINSLPSREDIANNGFGKKWLGNVIGALGGDWKKVSCRGTIDGYPYCGACFLGPDETDEKAEISDDGFLRLSITTAWEFKPNFYKFLQTKYPSFKFGFSATDEFGNFHKRQEPDPKMNVCKYDFDGEYYSYGERSQLLEDIRHELNIELDDSISDSELTEKIANWKANQKDIENQHLSFHIYEDVNIL